MTSVGEQAQAATPETGMVGSYDPDAPTGAATETTIALPPAAQPAIGAIRPVDGATVTAPVGVTALITPPTGQSIDSWCVRLRPSGEQGAGRTLKCGDGAPSGELTTLDPTVLVNGAYELAVEATASGGGIQRQSTTLVVEGDLKPGRSSMTYQDLEVPLHALPIQVLRTYDSFDKAKGDFGVGWNAAVANVRVQVNRSLGNGGWSHQSSGCSTLLGQSFCLGREFRDLSSHSVTVTWPDGRTEVFDFTPHAGSGGIYYDATAQFTARRGNTSTLTATGDATLQYWGDGNLYEADGETLYEPTRFRLTSKDGTKFELDTKLGLISAESRHGETLTVSRDGIESSTGRSVAFDRDAQDRITRITGPAGERLDYGYDAAGNLATVKDVSGDTLSYGYDAEHNLTSVTGPGRHPLRTLAYDADGRLASSTDGSGRTTEIDVDVAGRQEVVTEPGGAKISVLTSDEDGDVVRVEEISGGVTRSWRSEYDADGNRTRLLDPLGHETNATFDSAGNPTSITDPNGRTTRISYDDRGQPIKVVRPDGTTSAELRRDDFGDVIEAEVVFDSKVTTGAGLAELHDAELTFITLRARNAKLTAQLEALPASAWTQITLDRRGPHAKPEVHEQDVTVRGCPTPLRQIAVRGLGHEHPTLILTNDRTSPPKKIVGRYAKRMRIEQRLAESIRSFHLDALSSAVALNVDLDTTLTVWAAAAYDHLRQRLPGYDSATPDTIWRRFINTSGHITIAPNHITCRLKSRTYSPVMRSADLPDTEIPW